MRLTQLPQRVENVLARARFARVHGGHDHDIAVASGSMFALRQNRLCAS